MSDLLGPPLPPNSPGPLSLLPRGPGPWALSPQSPVLELESQAETIGMVQGRVGVVPLDSWAALRTPGLAGAGGLPKVGAGMTSCWTCCWDWN